MTVGSSKEFSGLFTNIELAMTLKAGGNKVTKRRLDQRLAK